MYEIFQRLQIYVTFPCFAVLFGNASVGSVPALHTLIGCSDTKLIANWPKAITCSFVYVKAGGTCELNAEVAAGNGVEADIHLFHCPSPCC